MDEAKQEARKMNMAVLAVSIDYSHCTFPSPLPPLPPSKK